jgi:AcrR family transcriptional regulator
MATGLRERKKHETREALSWATIQLAVERGFDNVLVEDIATTAGFSPRTFNNYFSSKAEAVAYRHLFHIEQIATRLRERPADEPLWDAIFEAAVGYYGGAEGHVPNPLWTGGVSKLVSHPAVFAEYLKASVIGERKIAEVVAERTGTDAAADMYPKLVAATVSTTIRVTSEAWLRADPPRPIGQILRSAFDQVVAGLPTP